MHCLNDKFSACNVAFLPTDAVSLSFSYLACLRQRRCSSAWAILSVLSDSEASAIVGAGSLRTFAALFQPIRCDGPPMGSLRARCLVGKLILVVVGGRAPDDSGATQ